MLSKTGLIARNGIVADWLVWIAVCNYSNWYW